MMLMIPPPFPDPSRWNDIHNEQEKTGIVNWTVIKDKKILSTMENMKQYIQTLHDANNNNNDNNDSNYDNDNEYDEVLEINPDWVSKLAPTIQKLKNRTSHNKANKSKSKKQVKVDKKKYKV